MKRIFRLWMVICMAVFGTFGSWGCAKDSAPAADANEAQVQKEKGVPPSEETIRALFVYPDGIPALAAANFIECIPTDAMLKGIDAVCQKSPELLVSSVMKKEADIAIVPSNVAAILYNKSAGYRVVGTATYGALSIVSSDELSSLSDLKGREIASFGKGLTPDLILRAVLKKAGVDPEKDVTISYFPSAKELAPALIGGKAKIAVLPQPVLATVLLKQPSLHASLSLDELWAKESGGASYPQSCLIMRDKLLKEHKAFAEHVIEAFFRGRAEAVDHPEELVKLSEKQGLALPAAVVEKGLLRPDEGNLISLYTAFYETLFDSDPQSIGGKVPGEDLYYAR